MNLRAGLRRVPVRLFDDAPPLAMAVEVFVPDQPVCTVLVCFAGGGMNRHYYDLRPAEAPQDESYSFAAQMRERGHCVVTLDYPGIGDSERPADSYALTSTRVADACAQAVDTVLREAPDLRAVGLGHSMGGMLAVLTQARAQRFDALALLGFSTRGLPQFVPPAARALLDDRAALHAQLPALARAQFGVDYPRIQESSRGAGLYGGAQAEARGVSALARARAPLLPVPAFQATLPGNVALEAAQIDVPVFIAVGEHDMTGPEADIASAFPASAATHTQMLPGAGHSHFLFPARVALFEALDAWLRALPPATPKR